MKLALASDEVHIWLADLNRAIAPLSQAKACLSFDEQERGKRYRFEQHQQRFSSARTILRILLSRYLAITPDEVVFAYEARGKPVLTDAFASHSLHFNSSHSGAFALYAFTRDRPVGIDLERIRLVPNLDQLAQRFFTENESTILQALPEIQQQRCFFRYWTCKEAYLKATGVGLTALATVEVNVSPAQPAQFSKIKNSSQVARQWQLHELEPLDGYAAAVAWCGSALTLKYKEFV